MNIFISYSSKSRAVVDALAQDLEAFGYNVWFDRVLAGGTDWWAEILNSIRRCNLFLFALTPESLDSVPCKLEYEYAHALHKRILPVMLSEVNIKMLPTTLQKLQIVDYRTQDKPQVLALGKALNSLPSAKPLPKPLPPKPEMPLSPIAKLHDQVEAAVLKPDEQKLVVAKLREFLSSDETANDARTLLKRMRNREDLLAVTEKEILRLLNIKKVAQYQPLKGKIRPITFTGHAEPIFSVAYAPDCQSVLTSSIDGTIRLWNIATGKERRRFTGHNDSIWNVAFSPDGRMIASTSKDHTVRLWDVGTGKEIFRFTGHTDSVWGVAFSPSGHTLITGSFDKTARLWDISSKTEIRQFIGHDAAVWGVAYAPDGRTVLTGSWDKTVRLWDIATGKELRRFVGHESPIVNVTYSPDGHTVLASSRDTAAKLWDIQTGKYLHEFKGHVAFAVAYSPDGQMILTGSKDKTARLWDTKSGRELHQFNGHTDAVISVAFAPDGCSILTGSGDKTARLWDASSSSGK